MAVNKSVADEPLFHLSINNEKGSKQEKSAIIMHFLLIMVNFVPIRPLKNNLLRQNDFYNFFFVG